MCTGAVTHGKLDHRPSHGACGTGCAAVPCGSSLAASARLLRQPLAAGPAPAAVPRQHAESATSLGSATTTGRPRSPTPD